MKGKTQLSRPTYKDQYGHLWKDIDLGYFEPPHLCSVVCTNRKVVLM